VVDYLRLLRLYSLAILASFIALMMALSVNYTLGLGTLIIALALLIGPSVFRALQALNRTTANPATVYMDTGAANALPSIENSIGAPLQAGLSSRSADFSGICHELLMEHELGIARIRDLVKSSQERQVLSAGLPG
jgi:hypothetical protein